MFLTLAQGPLLLPSPETQVMVALLFSQEPCWVETSTVLTEPAPAPWVSATACLPQGPKGKGRKMAAPERDASEDF